MPLVSYKKNLLNIYNSETKEQMLKFKKNLNEIKNMEQTIDANDSLMTAGGNQLYNSQNAEEFYLETSFKMANNNRSVI